MSDDKQSSVPEISDNPDNPDRRDFLTVATGVVAGAGIAAASWPFINSMNPSQDVLSKAKVEVDLNGIELGSAKTIAWQGKPVFVLHRTDQQIASMADSAGVKDPQADQERVKKPEWLVVVGVCTHLGCVPNRQDAGWFCPCHGSVFDNSGRILRGPAPTNLALPPYDFISDKKLVIGEA